MTTLLQQAFDEASRRSQEEQDLLAERLLAELAAENAFDRALDGSTDKLRRLAKQAIEEHRAGQTEALNLDQL